MIRALWYIVKVGLLIAVVVWLADRPGTVNVEWQDYTVRAQAG